MFPYIKKKILNLELRNLYLFELKYSSVSLVKRKK